MFYKNFKNIYVNLRCGNFQRAQNQSNNILYNLKNYTGGAIPQNLNNALTKIDKDSYKYFMILNFLLDYINKFDVKDINELKRNLETIRNTLKERLEQEKQN